MTKTQAFVLAFYLLTAVPLFLTMEWLKFKRKTTPPRKISDEDLRQMLLMFFGEIVLICKALQAKNDAQKFEEKNQ